MTTSNLKQLHLRTIELHGVTLSHSPLQNFFNVLTFKHSLEDARGPLNADKLAEMYDQHVKFANPDDAVPWLVTQYFDLDCMSVT